jgi:hypothetical protein
MFFQTTHYQHSSRSHHIEVELEAAEAPSHRRATKAGTKNKTNKKSVQAGFHPDKDLKIWTRDTRVRYRAFSVMSAREEQMPASCFTVRGKKGFNSRELFTSTRRRNMAACGLLMAIFTVFLSPGRSLAALMCKQETRTLIWQKQTTKKHSHPPVSSTQNSS